MIKALGDRKPSPIASTPIGGNFVKNSWLHIVIQIGTKIKGFVATEITHLTKKFTRIRRQVLGLTTKLVQLPPIRNGKKIPPNIPGSAL